jgi:hypothetical protein
MLRLLRLAWFVPLFAGCTTDAGASMYIVHNQVPEAGCVINADVGGDFRGRGMVDALGGVGYVFTPVAQSLIEAPSRDDIDRVIFVRGADVTLSFQDGLYSEGEVDGFREAGLANFRQPFSGSIMPGASTSFAFEILPGAMLAELEGKLGPDGATTVTAEVEIFGDVEGGEARGEPFFYPIEVCVGCLITNLGNCAELASDIEPAPGGECNVFQDAPVDCCVEGEDLICPAIPTGV